MSCYKLNITESQLFFYFFDFSLYLFLYDDTGVYPCDDEDLQQLGELVCHNARNTEAKVR